MSTCLVAVAALILPGCGDDDGDDTVAGTRGRESTERDTSSTGEDGTTTEDPTSTAEPTTATESTTTAAPAGSELTPRPPPPGVSAQFDYFEIGNGQCAEFADDPGPSAVAEFSSYTVLRDAVICLPGFDPESPTAVSVVAADGTVTDLTAPQPADDEGGPATVYEGVPYLHVELELYASIGEYQVTAEQGQAVATTSFAVEQPTDPLLRVRGPATGSRGASFTIQVAGLPAGEPAILDVYLLDGELYTYRTWITTAAADQLGRVEHVLSTTSADAPGRYCFAIRGSDPQNCLARGQIELG